MNLQDHSFEKILELSASIDDASRLKELIEELERLEKNLNFLRKRLKGKLAQEEVFQKKIKQQERQERKKSFRVIERKEDD